MGLFGIGKKRNNNSGEEDSEEGYIPSRNYTSQQRSQRRLQRRLATYVREAETNKRSTKIIVNVPAIVDSKLVLEDLVEGFKRIFDRKDWGPYNETEEYFSTTSKKTEDTPRRIIEVTAYSDALIMEAAGDSDYINKIRDLADKL